MPSGCSSETSRTINASTSTTMPAIPSAEMVAVGSTHRRLRGPLAELIPAQQRRQRVDRGAAVVPAGSGPDLEVQMAGARAAGVADDAEHLAGLDPLASAHDRGLAQVRVHVAFAGYRVLDHEVVARTGMPSAHRHDAAARRDERRAARGHDVLALVGVAGPAGAEAGATLTDVVLAPHGEHRPDERERADAGGSRGRGGALGRRTAGLRRAGARLRGAGERDAE